MKSLAQLIPYLLAYKYLGVFALNYVTSVIVPLPSATILLIIGSLSHRGYLNVFISFAVTVIATVCGDVTAYLFMRIFGTPKRLAGYRKRNVTGASSPPALRRQWRSRGQPISRGGPAPRRHSGSRGNDPGAQRCRPGCRYRPALGTLRSRAPRAAGRAVAAPGRRRSG